jgi:putative ABC transport system substrate-binding protein
MRRRTFITGITGLLVATAAGRARARQPGKVYRIAVAYPVPVAQQKALRTQVWLGELRRMGFVEGQNLVVERYSPEGQTEEVAEFARKVVRSNPDVIYTDGSRFMLAFKAATTTIPIVGISLDSVAGGIVPSLARPGGNITGVSVNAGIEMEGKRLELLREAIPGLSKVGFLATRLVWDQPEVAALRQFAQRVAISLIGPPLDAPFLEAEFRRVFAAMKETGAEALIVNAQGENWTNLQLIVDLTATGRLPTIFSWRDAAALGGLMAYAPDEDERSRHLAGQIAQILSGTSPGDIPYYQLTKFELVINLKTAKALGIEMPASLLASADTVIE